MWSSTSSAAVLPWTEMKPAGLVLTGVRVLAGRLSVVLDGKCRVIEAGQAVIFRQAPPATTPPS